jgi:hypothetical protein
MRTTIDIDDDVLAAAKDIARAEGRTMGQIISDLARRGLVAPDAGGLTGFAEAQAAFDTGAWPILPGSAGVIVTSDIIERIEADLDREDATPVEFAADGSFKPRFGGSDDAPPLARAPASGAGRSRRRRTRP